MKRLLVLIAPLAACTGVLGYEDIVAPPATGADASTPDGATPANDGSTIVDAHVDVDANVAATTCDPTRPFTKTLTTFDRIVSKGRPTLTSDELQMVFERGADTARQLFLAKRDHITDDFLNPTSSMPEIDQFKSAASIGSATSPSLSSDGLRLYFVGDDTQVVVGSRPDLGSPFGNFSIVTIPETDTGVFISPQSVFVSADDHALFIGSAVPEIDRVSLFAGINTAHQVSGGGTPVVSADESTLYFTANATGPISIGAIVAGSVGSSTALTAVQGGLNDGTGTFTAGFISADNCRLYYFHTPDNVTAVAARDSR